MSKKKKRTIIICVIIVAVLILLGVYYCFSRNIGLDMWDYMEEGSEWECISEEDDFEMTIVVEEQQKEARYRYKEKEGTWLMGIGAGNGVWRSVSFGYLCRDEDSEAVATVWSGRGKISKDRIKIKKISNEDLEWGIESGVFPKEIEDETIPDSITELELKRVK